MIFKQDFSVAFSQCEEVSQEVWRRQGAPLPLSSYPAEVLSLPPSSPSALSSTAPPPPPPPQSCFSQKNFLAKRRGQFLPEYFDRSPPPRHSYPKHRATAYCLVFFIKWGICRCLTFYVGTFCARFYGDAIHVSVKCARRERLTYFSPKKLS